MREKLFPLRIPPGMFKKGTRYQAMGRWYDGNLVRFLTGTIRPVGGWRRLKDPTDVNLTPLTGEPRAILGWKDNAYLNNLAIGTHSKAYVVKDGTLADITPATLTPGAGSGSFAGGTATLYGSGLYGAGTFGGGTAVTTLLDADTWSFDTFGEWLLGVLTNDGKIWVWKNNPVDDFVVLHVNAPTDVRSVVVTPERFIVALGAGANPRMVQWASQESDSDWTPTASNTAGDFTLPTTGRIMRGLRSRRQTLIWTDTDVWTMTYIGGVLVYAFDQAGDQCGLVAPNACAVVATRAFWMGRESFFHFDGFVQPLVCDVQDAVFGDINLSQRAKIYAFSVAQFQEVWWLYPSANSNVPDRYVVYNYEERHWTLGALTRAVGTDRSPQENVVMVTHGGEIYEHEVENDRGGSLPFLESGPIQVGGGDQVVRVQKIVPDERTLGELDLTLYASFFPTEVEGSQGPFPAANPTDVRLTGRYVRVRLDESATATDPDWRLGVVHLGMRPQGTR